MTTGRPARMRSQPPRSDMAVTWTAGSCHSRLCVREEDPVAGRQAHVGGRRQLAHDLDRRLTDLEPGHVGDGRQLGPARVVVGGPRRPGAPQLGQVVPAPRRRGPAVRTGVAGGARRSSGRPVVHVHRLDADPARPGQPHQGEPGTGEARPRRSACTSPDRTPPMPSLLRARSALRPARPRLARLLAPCTALDGSESPAVSLWVTVSTATEASLYRKPPARPGWSRPRRGSVRSTLPYPCRSEQAAALVGPEPIEVHAAADGERRLQARQLLEAVGEAGRGDDHGVLADVELDARIDRQDHQLARRVPGKRHPSRAAGHAQHERQVGQQPFRATGGAHHRHGDLLVLPQHDVMLEEDRLAGSQVDVGDRNDRAVDLEDAGPEGHLGEVPEAGSLPPTGVGDDVADVERRTAAFAGPGRRRALGSAPSAGQPLLEVAHRRRPTRYDGAARVHGGALGRVSPARRARSRTDRARARSSATLSGWLCVQVGRITPECRRGS